MGIHFLEGFSSNSLLLFHPTSSCSIIISSISYEGIRLEEAVLSLDRLPLSGGGLRGGGGKVLSPKYEEFLRCFLFQRRIISISVESGLRSGFALLLWIWMSASRVICNS